MRHEDIDWVNLWREARHRRSVKGKGRSEWDARAAGFARRHQDSGYAREVIAALRPDPAWTVLDVGAGPGTLALPLASEVASVTALDFSGRMLAILREEAARGNRANITTIEAAWEDDWEALGIAPHDLVLASRSLSVDDPRAALMKAHRWARKKVFLTDRVGPGPFDPEVFAAVGRPFHPGPDYIFTVNILYGMGIYAHVDFIPIPHATSYPSFEAARDSFAWMLDDMSAEEEERLDRFARERIVRRDDGSLAVPRRVTPVWAAIWWEKGQNGFSNCTDRDSPI